jgi:hypothetical protein
MTEPITITTPSNEELLLQAKMRGVSASGTFPLEEGKQYILALVRTSEAIVPDDVIQAIDDLTDVEAAFRIGNYITETGVPEGKQIEAIAKVKIRLSNIPVEVVEES